MPRSTRVLAAALSVSLISASLAACASNEVARDTAAKGGGNAADIFHQPLDCDDQLSIEDLLAFRAPKAKKPYHITVMEVSLAGYYYQAIAYGAEKAAKDAGATVDVVAGNGYTTPQAQLSQVENAIQRGTDAIVLAPVDLYGSAPVVQKAKAAGIPVINMSTEVNSPDLAGTVLQDDYRLGQQGADQLARLAPDGGQGVVLAGPATATWSRKRAAGFADRLKEKYPKLKIAAAPTQVVDPAQGLKDFTNAVQANPDIKWIYSVFYYQLLPEALPAKYRSLPFVTTGYEPTAIKSLQSGAVSVTTGVLNVWMGYVPVAQAVSHLNGDTIPNTTCMPAPTLTKNDIGSDVAKGELFPASYQIGKPN